jgi:hypothetical protein
MVRDHRIETYDFPTGSLIGATISAGTWRSINGILAGVQVKANNWDATGSLILMNTTTGMPVWNLVSGTATGNVAQSGTYYPLAYASTSNNTTLSGTAPITAEIPLFGEYTLTGIGMGTNKSGLGVTLIYKMG